MDVYESNLPGVGKKFEVDLASGEQITVLTHYNGKRDVYKQTDDDGENAKIFSVTDQEARQLGTILEGAHYQPIETEQVAMPLGNSTLEWITIDEESPLLRTELREANIRHQTGVSVIAIQREDETIPNPGPGFTIRAGDVLVTLGDREDHAAFDELFTDESE